MVLHERESIQGLFCVHRKKVYFYYYAGGGGGGGQLRTKDIDL